MALLVGLLDIERLLRSAFRGITPSRKRQPRWLGIGLCSGLCISALPGSLSMDCPDREPGPAGSYCKSLPLSTQQHTLHLHAAKPPVLGSRPQPKPAGIFTPEKENPQVCSTLSPRAPGPPSQSDLPTGVACSPLLIFSSLPHFPAPVPVLPLSMCHIIYLPSESASGEIQTGSG